MLHNASKKIACKENTGFIGIVHSNLESEIVNSISEYLKTLSDLQAKAVSFY